MDEDNDDEKIAKNWFRKNLRERKKKRREERKKKEIKYITYREEVAIIQLNWAGTRKSNQGRNETKGEIKPKKK